MPDCPTCGESISGSSGECPECGAPTGSTASFEPVTPSGGSEAVVVEPSDWPVLVVRKGPQLGERFYLDRPTLAVGRDPGSDIFLNDITVSRAHAVLTLEGPTVHVRDVGSLNGLYLNGVLVDSAELGNGDVLQVGTFQMVFLSGRSHP